jgi:hypothetical protein
MRQMRIWIILFLCVGFTVVLSADTKKRYEVESGAVKYVISGGGNVMGVSMEINGVATSVFRDWGMEELYEEQSTSVTMGQKTQEHTMYKILGEKIYVVDFTNKMILEYSNEALVNSKLNDFAQQGKDMLIAMGGKKIGEEKFMGYDCEIWELAPVKLWVHKGVMLKSEATMMGIQYTTTAIEVDLDSSASDNQFLMPDFPIKEAETNMMSGFTMGEDGAPRLDSEQLEQLQEAMKNFQNP